MKKIIATLVMLVLLMASITSVYADSTSDIKSIDTVISDIRAELNLKTTDLIRPEKVSNDLLEQLGDSVMEAMIGNHDLHEQMDVRMGGDGSATLTSMHIRMGYNYLYRSLNGSTLGYGMAVNGNWNNMMGNQYRSSQAPCWNNGGSTPGSTYQEPINSTNTTNSSNWNNMRWNNNGMMN